jgi:ribosome biogenesis ATPase
MLRPGRLDKLVLVPLPTAEARGEILLAATRKMPLDESVSLTAIAHDPRCGGFSGADLSSLAREAAVAALKACAMEDTEAAPVPRVSAANFERAFTLVQPSVSPQDEQRYKKLAERLRRTRSEAKSGAGAVGGVGAGANGAPTPANGAGEPSMVA